VKEPHDVLLRLGMRLLVGLGDVRTDAERELLRRRLVAEFLGGAAVHVVVELREAERREDHHERIAALRRLADRLERTLPRQPDRRVWLLKRPWPGVHVGNVEILPLPIERSGLGPRLDDEVVRLPEALARRRRVRA